ncbi:hypothetical protein [Arthrobacter sp. StoSoilB5]|jgi:hypothetical protein|uniref:hypothetical protein n=1 Tax=Arthrobacter sp. StoSoilB5 TaxID=2830992 RepID=UPI001CC5D1CD|nr:hypothetical protein [Arthrobacter sp. StoSoilB5]BCW43950.1 hypothetical protein StoSoilB5_11340 [Arthrobacter sp. StoSoilB5]
MNYILVLQWPGRSEVDYDELIAMEDLLLEELPESHGVVDGHDFGSGEMNIFVHTERPVEAFADVMTALSSQPRWTDARAAYRPIEADEFVILWPKTLKHFSVS